MQPLARVTPATVDILRILLGEPDPTWGLVIIKATNRPPGTVYPVLERLERGGWVESEWEDATDRPGPRRRLYRLTRDGAVAARETVTKFDRAQVARRTGIAGASA